MALTLLSNPGAITFAHNPCIIQLRADDGVEIFDALGATAKIVYLDADRFATNDDLVIAYDEPDGTSETITFTAKAVADDDNEIPDASFTGSDSEYWLEIRNKLAAHPRVSPFFSVDLISESGNKIRIRTRSTDAGWALTVTNDAGLTVEDVAATDTTLPQNYKVRLEVFVEETYREGDFVRAAQLEGYPEAGTGQVLFDIASILAANCRATRLEPLTPIFGTNTPELADNIRRYYFRYTEESGAPVVAEEWSYSATKLAMDGGVSQALFAETDFFAGLTDDDSLLTWMPNNRKIGLEQPEFLPWYNFNSVAVDAFLLVTWFDINDNATTEVVVFDGAPLTVRSKEVGLFPVSPTALGIDGEANCYKYKVRVVEESGVSGVYNYHSQEVTYYVDREYYESERYLQYINSFGVPDVWRCTGELGKRLKVDRNIMAKSLKAGYSQYDSDSAQYGRTIQNELVYRTGFMTADEAIAIQQLLISNDVYDVSAAGYIPLRLLTDSFQVTETRQDLHSYQFSAVARLDSVNLTIKKVTSSTGEWQQTDGESWFDTLAMPWQTP
jgi:hypothetical protein